MASKSKTVIYIDESGIHKQAHHSTFALVYITFDNIQEVEAAIIKIERSHKITAFHWRELPWKLREAFIMDAARLKFKAKVAIFQNPVSPPEALEWAIVNTLVEKEFEKIVIDGDKPRWVERQIKKNLRDKGIQTKKLKMVRSSGSPAVRLADAIAGLARAYYDDKDGRAAELWNVLRKRITAQILGGQTDE